MNGTDDDEFNELRAGLADDPDLAATFDQLSEKGVPSQRNSGSEFINPTKGFIVDHESSTPKFPKPFPGPQARPSRPDSFPITSSGPLIDSGSAPTNPYYDPGGPRTPTSSEPIPLVAERGGGSWPASGPESGGYAAGQVAGAPMRQVAPPPRQVAVDDDPLPRVWVLVVAGALAAVVTVVVLLLLTDPPGPPPAPQAPPPPPVTPAAPAPNPAPRPGATPSPAQPAQPAQPSGIPTLVFTPVPYPQTPKAPGAPTPATPPGPRPRTPGAAPAPTTSSKGPSNEGPTFKREE